MSYLYIKFITLKILCTCMYICVKRKGRRERMATTVCCFTYQIPTVVGLGDTELLAKNSIQAVHLGGRDPSTIAITDTFQGLH